jgi:hypothetical protein
MSLPPVIRSYTKILIREKDYRKRGLEQIREFNKSFETSKEELRQTIPPNSAVEVGLPAQPGGSDSPKVYLFREVKSVPGSVTHKRVQQFLATQRVAQAGQAETLSAQAAQVAEALEERRLKAEKKAEQESRKRERAETREKKLAAKNAMDQRVAQVRKVIAARTAQA